MRDLPPNLPLVDESFPEEWSARLQRSTTYGDLVLESDRLCAILHTFTALETGRRLWWADLLRDQGMEPHMQVSYSDVWLAGNFCEPEDHTLTPPELSALHGALSGAGLTTEAFALTLESDTYRGQVGNFDEIAMYNLPINRGPLKVCAVDRSWSWHTESGGYRTYLGAPAPVIDAVLAHPELEAFEIPVSCRLDAVRTPLPRSLGSS
jgi:hypothetical protein